MSPHPTFRLNCSALVPVSVSNALLAVVLRVRRLDARSVQVIRIDAVWLATTPPMDFRGALIRGQFARRTPEELALDAGANEVSRRAVLKNEQIAWIKEKEAKCKLVGSSEPMVAINFKLQFTEQRLETLKQFK